MFPDVYQMPPDRWGTTVPKRYHPLLFRQHHTWQRQLKGGEACFSQKILPMLTRLPVCGGNIPAGERVADVFLHFSAYCRQRKRAKVGTCLAFYSLDSVWTPNSWDGDPYIQLISSGHVLTDIPRSAPRHLPVAAKSSQSCSLSITSKRQWTLTVFPPLDSLRSGFLLPSL